MATTRFSNELLTRAWEVLKPRLQVPRMITTAPECGRMMERIFISYSSAQNVFRFIMFQLVTLGYAKHIKRGQWQIITGGVETIPALSKKEPIIVEKINWGAFAVPNVNPQAPSQADMAAEKLLSEGFTDKRAWEIAEQYGVTIQSLLIAVSYARLKPKPENKEQVVAKSIPNKAYQFKTYDEDN